MKKMMNIFEQRRKATKVASLIIISAAYEEQRKEEQERSSIREYWVDPLWQQRDIAGYYAAFRDDLRDRSPRIFKNFCRMNVSDFDFLLNRVKPLIEKQNTRFRRSISAGERLCVTLRYLASGDSMASIAYLFRIGRSTVSKIIAETCIDIYEVLLQINIYKMRLEPFCDLMPHSRAHITIPEHRKRMVPYYFTRLYRFNENDVSFSIPI